MKQILALLLLIAASCLAVSLSAQTVRNVPGTYATIAAAISASANGDIIEIAAGTYTESGLTVNKSLTFRGAGQTTTIIQAAITPNSASTRIFQVTPGVTVHFKKMTLQNGYARSGAASSSGHGGGAIDFDECSFTLEEVTFLNNRCLPTANLDGGAISMDAQLSGGSTCTIKKCIFQGNEVGRSNASPDGGAFYVTGGSGSPDLVFDSCQFISNYAGDRGGAFLASTKLVKTIFSNCYFFDNEAGDDAGAAGLQNFSLSSCTFEQNTCADVGGAVRTNSSGNETITNCTFYNNQGDDGGAIWIFISSPGSVTLTNNTIYGNSATSKGGGIYIQNSGTPSGSVNLTNNILVGNKTGTLNIDIENDGLIGTNLRNMVEGCRGTCPGFAGSVLRGIGTFGNNGGFTKTFSLLNTSNAINVGTSTGAPSEDQRGYARIGLPDLGAYEFGASPPSTGPTALCQNLTVPLSPSGTATIPASSVNGGSSGGAMPYNLSISPSGSFSCADIGDNTLTLTVTDQNGASSTCTSTVTVEDRIAPTAVCPNSIPDVVLNVANGGSASLPANIGGGNSTDNCGSPSETSPSRSFSCGDLGSQTVRLTATDGTGNQSSTVCSFNVVGGPNDLFLTCRSFTLNLSGGSGTVTTSNIAGANGVTICTNSVSFQVTPSAFSCADIGQHTVTLSLTEQPSNRTATCTSVVTVADPNNSCCAPPTALCQNATVQLDANGFAQVATSQVDNGSTAPCDRQGIDVAPNTFGCQQIGANTVQLTVTDVNNASASCTATVTVQDNSPPTLSLNGTDPISICQGSSFTDPGASFTDNCASGTIQGNSSSVDVNKSGTYIVTYDYTDPGGNMALQVTRTVIVNPTPGTLSQQGCGSCGQIRSTICQGDPAPDLQALVMSNPTYEAGAVLNWYADNSGSQGGALPGAPTVNPNTVGTNFYWVSQQLGNCEGPAIRVRSRVKRRFTPNFSLPAQGCGGTGLINLANGVSDPNNKATAYTFYDVDPATHPLATPLGSVSATNGTVNAGQILNVSIPAGGATYWVQSTVPNGCGGVASATVNAPAAAASLDPVSSLLVTSGDLVTVNFTGTFTQVVWYNLGNPSIGIVGMAGLGNLSFTASNTGSTGLTANLFVIAYNGGCAGQMQSFSITVSPGITRIGKTNSLDLAAQKLNAHDVQLSWNLQYEAELIGFEVQKRTAAGEEEEAVREWLSEKNWQTIGQVKALGEGTYDFIDEGGMGNVTAYRLKLIHADGRLIWSNEVKVNMHFVDNHLFDLFPNPTAGQFQVKARFPMSEAYTWQLSDVMGKTLMTGEMKSQQTTIQMESLATGMYHLVMISPEGRRYLMKVVKQ